MRSFTKSLRAKTYRAGLYGFGSSSAKAIATAKNHGPARQPVVRPVERPGDHHQGLPLDPKLYTAHSRGHQYKASSKETRGDHTINVDRNA